LVHESRTESTVSNHNYVTTPINIRNLEEELTNHPDQSFVKELIEGLKYGFNTGISKLPQTPFESKNLLSARSQPKIVDTLIEQELSKGFFEWAI
jgi:hypothetical protein